MMQMVPHAEYGYSTLTAASNPAYDARSIDSRRASAADSLDFPVDGSFFTIALHDFHAAPDSIHLPFRRGDILEIVRTEETGWWAAALYGRIGWIPKPYVERISEKFAAYLNAIDISTRVSVLEQHYGDFPEHAYYHPQLHPDDYRNSRSLAPRQYMDEDVVVYDHSASSSSLASNLATLSIESSSTPPAHYAQPSPDAPYMPSPTLSYSSADPQSPAAFGPAAITPDHGAPGRPQRPRLNVNMMLKTTTYTPVHPSSNPRTSLPNIGDRSPSNIASSSSSTSASGGAISEPRLGSRPNSALPSSSNVSVVSTTEYESRPRAGTLPGRGGKIKRLTGEDDAQAYVNARVAIASQPLYLKPAYGEGSIRMNPEGDVICGTVEALVEHLTIDSSLRKQQEKQYRYTFLTTFKSFISAESLLSLLTERYRPEQPRDLSDAQYDEWKSKKLHPMQNRVLMVLESWIVHHHLLDTDAWIARKVVEFLSSIQTPASLALTAKHIIQTIENMGKAQTPIDAKPTKSPVKPTKPAAKRKKSKPYSKDFAKMDPGLLAEHLTLLEAQIYSKIRSNECLLWANYQTGEQVANLTAWRRMGDKLSAWVKMSVLDCDQLGKRADVIDLWILVAEKCKDAKNVSSMTSIVMGLSHITITKLKLSWAHVKNNARLDPLVKLADPANSYAAYRAFYQTLDGPCVPYLGQYLAAIEHIEKHYPDIVALPDADPARPMIDFVKRTKWAEVIAKMLKYQTKPYAAQLDDGSADPVVLAFVQDQLNSAVNVDSGYFAGRSENLQAAETEHADIRRNLKAAGF